MRVKTLFRSLGARATLHPLRSIILDTGGIASIPATSERLLLFDDSPLDELFLFYAGDPTSWRVQGHEEQLGSFHHNNELFET